MNKQNRNRYFDHIADIGIIGRGETLCDAFTDAAKSMFSIMAELTKIKAQLCVEFEFVEPDVELALVTYLNALLDQSRSQHIILKTFQLQQLSNHLWHSRACGNHWNVMTNRGTEVKGATLTMLSVKSEAGQWEARCVVDV